MYRKTVGFFSVCFSLIHPVGERFSLSPHPFGVRFPAVIVCVASVKRRFHPSVLQEVTYSRPADLFATAFLTAAAMT